MDFLFQRKTLHDKYYLSSDLELECYTKEWNDHAIAASFMIFVYILGIPIYFYYTLKSFHDSNQLSKKSIAYAYGFMYLGYG